MTVTYTNLKITSSGGGGANVLEAMNPIPEDYRDNKYWQVA
jgi:hypothetical protein